MTLGLVCDACDGLNPVDVGACARCGAPLFAAADEPLPPDGSDGTDFSDGPHDSDGSEEEAAVAALVEEHAPAEAAPGYLDLNATLHDAPLLAAVQEALEPAAVALAVSSRECPNCGATVPQSHKFCGECGHRLEGGGPSARHTMYQHVIPEVEGRARLVVIRGEGADSISYHLAGVEHVVGRTDGEILFPDDQLVSPRHANFFYRDNDLHVRDEGSRNGIFLRIKGPVRLAPGQPFLVGEQLLAVQPANVEGLSAADAEGTYYYGSPRRPARIRLVQILAGGDIGMALRVPGDFVTIGREGNSVNFAEDPFISGHHAQVAPLDDGNFRLSDVGSKNGTFVRILGETRLEHGDFVFLGQQLLRVEIV